jgi:hypothetical protein
MAGRCEIAVPDRRLIPGRQPADLFLRRVLHAHLGQRHCGLLVVTASARPWQRAEPPLCAAVALTSQPVHIVREQVI